MKIAALTLVSGISLVVALRQSWKLKVVKQELKDSRRQTRILQGVLRDLNGILAMVSGKQQQHSVETIDRMELMARTAGDFCRKEEQMKKEIQEALKAYSAGPELQRVLTQILDN